MSAVAKLSRVREGSTSPLALVVEDDPDAARIAVSMLRMFGFRTKQAGSANQALLAASEELPDLILLDICLPDMNGVGFVQVASKMPGFSKTKVLAASALYPEKGPIGAQLKRLGVLHYLDKPFTVDRLRKKVHQLFPHLKGQKPKATLEDVSGLSLPATVSCFGEERDVLLLAATPDKMVVRGQKLPVGQSLTLRLEHAQLEFDEMVTHQLVAMATVEECLPGPGGAISKLSVLVTRPPLEFDRMCEELPDP